MAKGDKVRVLLQVGENVHTHDFMATTNGSSIEVDRPKLGEVMTVTVLNARGRPAKTMTMKKEAVLMISEEPAIP